MLGAGCRPPQGEDAAGHRHHGVHGWPGGCPERAGSSDPVLRNRPCAGSTTHVGRRGAAGQEYVFSSPVAAGSNWMEPRSMWPAGSTKAGWIAPRSHIVGQQGAEEQAGHLLSTHRSRVGQRGSANEFVISSTGRWRTRHILSLPVELKSSCRMFRLSSQFDHFSQYVWQRLA